MNCIIGFGQSSVNKKRRRKPPFFTPKHKTHILSVRGDEMKKKKISAVALVLIGLSVGMILSILIPEALIILILACAILLAGILILR